MRNRFGIMMALSLKNVIFLILLWNFCTVRSDSIRQPRSYKSTLCEDKCYCSIKQDIVSCQESTITDLRTAKIPRSTDFLMMSQNAHPLGVLTQANFTGKEKLRNLILDNCGVTKIDTEAFVGLKELHEVQIKDNQFQLRLAERAFAKTNLRLLIISGTPKVDIHPNAFDNANIDKIYMLNISLSDIPLLRSETLANSLTGLRILQNKGLKFIPPNAFATLKKLKRLFLYENRITEIAPDAFNTLDLDELNLARNPQLAISKYSFRGVKVKKLDLSDCFILALDAQVFHPIASSLNSLVLHKNKLSQIAPGTFSGMTRMTVLDLSFNQINSIQSGAFMKSNIELIKLQNNRPLYIMEGALCHLNTKSISLGNTGFADPERLLPILTNLTNLDVENNEIRTLDSPAWVKVMQSLQTIRLQNNRLDCTDPMTQTLLLHALENAPDVCQNYLTIERYKQRQTSRAVAIGDSVRDAGNKAAEYGLFAKESTSTPKYMANRVAIGPRNQIIINSERLAQQAKAECAAITESSVPFPSTSGTSRLPIVFSYPSIFSLSLLSLFLPAIFL